MSSTSIGFSLALTSQDGSGDIQKSQFVCSILTVNPGAFNRIARIPEIYKMDTFNLGGLTGVTVSFSIGRNICKPAAEKYGRRFFITPERLIKAEKWFGRFGAPFIVFAYFVPGMRHVTPYLCGITRLSYYKVILCSAVGAFLWVVTFTYIGRLIQANFL